MNSTYAIQVKNLYKSYSSGPQKVEVIKGLNLEIKSGDVAIITGPSGVGKSTLLHVLGLLDRHDSGEIKIGGVDISSLNEETNAKLRNETIGFVFQFHHLLPEFSALENVLIPSMIYKKEKETREYALHLLDMVGLSHRLNHRPRELSGGEQQRVAVARAIVNKPQIVLADEPTGNLDKANGESLYSLLLKLNQEMNQTLLIVTHNEHMTAKANHLIELEDGKVSKERFPEK
ncbi:MAG: ABC transporter ATP-binding protein [Calditrichaeota bacterium]|nr:MAG: ABC transporter ATP-binding protein [Calditrichota bacterium]MBL1207583.1 ABC transporter ATP-binding protein [Calditrichota bacterium]NOG47415.1 ABC transporter ATP-binding protein [Calditrichota bacterium]